MHDFPAHYYGPNGENRVFDRKEDVPAGWHDHPSKHVIDPASTGSKPAETGKENGGLSKAQTGAGPANPGDQSNTLDRDGWPWDAKLHAATKSFTNAGLWRMKVGASRPAPKPGFPKTAPLDL